MRLIFLDTGPLGLLSNPRGKPEADHCRQWAKDLLASGARLFVPEIADYEVRRELLRVPPRFLRFYALSPSKRPRLTLNVLVL